MPPDIEKAVAQLLTTFNQEADDIPRHFLELSLDIEKLEEAYDAYLKANEKRP